jgi:hypothetical protein
VRSGMRPIRGEALAEVLGVSAGGHSGEGPLRVGDPPGAIDPEAALHDDCGERPRWVESRPSHQISA